MGMVELLVSFMPKNKPPLDVINKLQEQLALCLKRNDIDEYEISIGNSEEDTPEGFHSLIHDEIGPAQEKDQANGEQ